MRSYLDMMIRTVKNDKVLKISSDNDLLSILILTSHECFNNFEIPNSLFKLLTSL